MKKRIIPMLTSLFVLLFATACSLRNGQPTSQTTQTVGYDHDILYGDQWYLNYIPEYYGALSGEPILYDQEISVDDISNWYYSGKTELVNVEGADEFIQYLQNTVGVSLNADEKQMIQEPVREYNSSKNGSGNFDFAIYPDGTWKAIVPFSPSLRQIDEINHSTNIVLSSWMFDEDATKLKELEHDIYDPQNSSYGIFYKNDFSVSGNGDDYELERYYLGGLNGLSKIKMTQSITLSGEVRKAGHAAIPHSYEDGFMITGNIVFEIKIDGMTSPYCVTYRYFANEEQNMDWTGGYSMTDSGEYFSRLDLPSNTNHEDGVEKEKEKEKESEAEAEEKHKEILVSKMEKFSPDGQPTEYTLYDYSDDTLLVTETTLDMNGNLKSVVKCTYTYDIGGISGDRKITSESFEDGSYTVYEYDDDRYLIEKRSYSSFGVKTEVIYTPVKQSDGTVICMGNDGSKRYYDKNKGCIRYEENNIEVEWTIDEMNNPTRMDVYEDGNLSWYATYEY